MTCSPLVGEPSRTSSADCGGDVKCTQTTGSFILLFYVVAPRGSVKEEETGRAKEMSDTEEQTGPWRDPRGAARALRRALNAYKDAKKSGTRFRRGT